MHDDEHQDDLVSLDHVVHHAMVAPPDAMEGIAHAAGVLTDLPPIRSCFAALSASFSSAALILLRTSGGSFLKVRVAEGANSTP